MQGYAFGFGLGEAGMADGAVAGGGDHAEDSAGNAAADGAIEMARGWRKDVGSGHAVVPLRAWCATPGDAGECSGGTTGAAGEPGACAAGAWQS